MIMKEFEFCIIASGLDPESEDFEQRFYDAGCDDATVSFQKGCIIVDFTREARSIDEAIVSAMKAVEAAGARVERIEPDPLVSLSDIAARSGMSRAAMTQYAKGQRGKQFPPPVARVTSDSPLWDWATVARWLFRNEKISRDAAIEAEVIRAANAAAGAPETRLQEIVQRSVRSYEKRLGKNAA
jgi:predicted DNA-binding transcriptional regulator AlpA